MAHYGLSWRPSVSEWGLPGRLVRRTVGPRIASGGRLERRGVEGGVQMEEIPRQRLRELWVKYGHSLLDEPGRCAGLLRDTCYGQYRLEITVLVHALQDGVATALLTTSEGIPIEVVLAQLTQRLQDHLGLSAEAARWAVESWAWAVGTLAPEALVPAPDPVNARARRLPQERQAHQAAEPAR